MPIELTDALRVARPVVVLPVLYKLKAGESLYKDRYSGKTYIVRPTLAVLRADNRTRYQRELDQKSSAVKRRLYEELKYQDEGMKGILAMAKLVSPSTYVGAALRNNGKSYMDNLLSGEGTGDEVTNLAVDLVAPIALGKPRAALTVGRSADPGLVVSDWNPLWKLDTKTGLMDLKDYLRSDDWMKRAEKVFSKTEALSLRDWLLGNLGNGELIKISALPTSEALKGTRGLTTIHRTLPLRRLDSIDLLIYPGQSVEKIRGAAVHEGLHASTLSLGSRSIKYSNMPLAQLELLRILILNAEKLADKLKTDPRGEIQVYNDLISLGYSPDEAWNQIWDWEVYILDPQEARAFGVNENIYRLSKGLAGEPMPDTYKKLFTKESMDNLLKGIFTVTPVVIGVLDKK